MPTSATDFQTKVDKFSVDMDRADAIVNGDATTVVTVDGGVQVPSFAKLQTAGAVQVQGATDAKVAAQAAAGQAIASAAGIANIAKSAPSQRDAQATTDSAGKIIGYTSARTGRAHTASAQIRTLNNRRPEALTLQQQMFATRFADCALFINTAGQSRANGNIQNLKMTTVQDGKSFAYPYGIASPTAYYPLLGTDGRITGYADAGNTVVSGDFPMMGMVEFLYELLWKENGLTPADLGMTLFTANNTLGGTPISANNKGSARYQQSVAQVARMAGTDAPALNLKARALGTFWSQGEADVGHSGDGGPYAYYLATLGQLAKDFATDWATNLPKQPASLVPHLIACGVDSYGSGSDRFGVTRAILQLAINFAAGVMNAPPVGFSTATYFMDFRGDVPAAGSPANTVAGVHLMGRDAKWLGAFAALYLKRVFFDGVTWAPMVPKLVEIENGAIFITLNMRASNTKLVVAETLDVNQTYNGKAVYQQPGRGWSGVDTSGTALSFTQLPDVVGPATIRLIPTVSPANVARLDYAQQPAVKMWPFGYFTPSGLSVSPSGAGNFRDNYGDLVFYDGANGPASAVNRRMDNWLPTHSIIPAANAAGFSWPTS